MTTTTEERPQRTYGNWSRPSSAGLLKLGTAGTAGLIGVLMVTAIALMINPLFGIGLLLIGLIALAPLAWRNHNQQTGWELLGNRLGWLVTRLTKQDTFRSGPLTRIGRVALPGVAAPLEVFDALDANGTPFALISHPGPGHVTAVMRSEPEGTHLVDQLEVDAKVARFGEWLAALGTDRELVGVTVSITTAPDSGHTLREAIAGQTSDEAHPLAKAVLDEIAQDYPESASTLTCEIAITWKRNRPGSTKRRSIEEMAVEVGRRLPGIYFDLSQTGAGAPTLLQSEDLAAIVRSAYDPTTSSELDAGAPIGWDNAGPVSADETPSTYFHDSGISRSWYMVEPPRGFVMSNCLTALLQPHSAVARKRVTLVYRPLDPKAAVTKVDKAVRDTSFNRGTKKRPDARDQIAMEAALQAAQEEARGAGLVRFAMVITATVHEGQNIEDAALAIEHIGPASRIDLRPASRQQATAFAAALPLGIYLHHHSRIPAGLREASR